MMGRISQDQALSFDSTRSSPDTPAPKIFPMGIDCMLSARCRVAATCLFSSFILAACGGGGGGGNPGGGLPTVTQTSFPVGGTVTGLVSSGLVLQQNTDGDEVTIGPSGGTFTFPVALPSGSAYSVSIKTQPNIGPLQVCSVTNG